MAMGKTSSAALVATFVALIIGSNFALADLPNVKLLDTLVFVSAFLFGFRIGAYVAILSELTWTVVSPWGFGGAITPFLVIGELLYAFAGWLSARVWRGVRPMSTNSLFMGSLLAICAFIWDIETNLGTAIIASWPNITFEKIIAWQISGIPFMLVHELSDFALGSFLAPLIILYIPRVARTYYKINPGVERT